MSVIVPAILPQSLEDLEHRLVQLEGLVKSIQIDVVDGKFVSPACWPYTPGGAEELQELSDHGERLSHGGAYKVEIDLMVQDPGAVAGAFIAAGASRLVIHAENGMDIGAVLHDLEHVYGYDKEFSSGLLTIGLALHPNTDLALIEPHLADIDFVQFMGIDRIGLQGQVFDRKVVQKIRVFHKRHPDMALQVDGGVSQITAPELLSAGAERLIVGSDLWRALNLAKEIKTLEHLAERFGIYE